MLNITLLSFNVRNQIDSEKKTFSPFCEDKNIKLVWICKREDSILSLKHN